MRVDPADVPLFFITGISASGKSTVAQGLAERFDRSAHVRGDQFRRAVVGGREEMTAAPSPEALDQLRLRYRLMARTADAYVEAGFATVAQDVVLGTMLPEVVDLFVHDVTLVVLVPSVGAVTERERDRPKVGYARFTPHDLDLALRTETPRLGHWIDSSDLTPDETVDEILRLARRTDATG